MSEEDALRLAGLICSRLCHDLIGPAGAVANGLELLAEPATAGQALELTQATSRQLNLRLGFFRRAYGTGQSLTWDEAYEVAAGFFEGSRHVLDWHAASELENDARLARIALNMLLCLMDVTPLGARLTVTAGPAPAVSAEGELRSLAVLKAALADPLAGLAEVAPRDVQPWLTARLAHAAGRRLVLEQDDDEHVVLVLERG